MNAIELAAAIFLYWVFLDFIAKIPGFLPTLGGILVYKCYLFAKQLIEWVHVPRLVNETPEAEAVMTPKEPQKANVLPTHDVKREPNAKKKTVEEKANEIAENIRQKTKEFIEAKKRNESTYVFGNSDCYFQAGSNAFEPVVRHAGSEFSFAPTGSASFGSGHSGSTFTFGASGIPLRRQAAPQNSTFAFGAH